MVAVSASQAIQAAAPSSSFHFHLCNPQTRRSPAGALQEREHERRPRRATEHSAPLKTGTSNATAEFQVPPSSGQAAKAKPSPLSGTRRFREEKRRAIRLNRRRRRCRREGDPFASRPTFCSSPH